MSSNYQGLCNWLWSSPGSRLLPRTSPPAVSTVPYTTSTECRPDGQLRWWCFHPVVHMTMVYHRTPEHTTLNSECGRNRQNQEIMVCDWLNTNHVTQITGYDWLITNVLAATIVGSWRVDTLPVLQRQTEIPVRGYLTFICIWEGAGESTWLFKCICRGEGAVHVC